jgi:hypothetical protein
MRRELLLHFYGFAAGCAARLCLAVVSIVEVSELREFIPLPIQTISRRA